MCTLVHPHLVIISTSPSPFLIHPFPISLLFKPLCIKKWTWSWGGDVPTDALTMCVCVCVCLLKMHVSACTEWGNTYLAYECTVLSGRSCRRRWPLVSDRTKRNFVNILAKVYTNIMLQVCQCNNVTKIDVGGITTPTSPQTQAAKNKKIQAIF